MHNGVVKFYKPSCGPCNIQDTYLLELQPDIIKVNLEDHPEQIESLGILSVPTLIRFKNGLEIDRLSGITTKEELRKWLQS